MNLLLPICIIFANIVLTYSYYRDYNEFDCENDGYCIPNTSDDGWECLCKADFYGKNCETRKFVA